MTIRKTRVLTGLVLLLTQGVFAAGVQELDATRVRLLPGSPFYDRQELHRSGYLASLDPDRLLFHYRALAGLPQPDGVNGGYGGWDSGFIRGHMAGHYLSAASRMAAATGDASFREKADYIVTELAKCQDALKQDGYLAAFPSGAFDRLEGKRGNSGGVVVPYYTIHKIMAGLLDAHHYLGNTQALQVAVKMADYFKKRLAALNAEQIERIFRTDGSRNPQNEFGAMSDVLAELYTVTGDRRHLDAARLFNRSWFIDPLAKGEDRLAGLHGNTHVAQALGIAHCASLTGDVNEAKASENFWKIITGAHSFIIGGNSVHEWIDEPGVETGPSIDGQKRLPATTAESCNTHNMLKLTARLFERNQNAQYADYFERALYNHLLATVAPDTGAMTYFMPMYGHFRTYLDGTHCCVGSGIENPPRYGEGIYFQQDHSLWVNLYIPSELDWREAGMVLRQEGDVTRGDPVRFTVAKASGEVSSRLNFRIPHWISQPAVVKVNDTVQEDAGRPSTYVSLERHWQAGDVIILSLPAALRLEKAKDDPPMVSAFFGPVLLAGELGRENMPKNDHADKDAYLKMPAIVVPDIVASSTNPADWLSPIEEGTLAFRAYNAGPANEIIFRPLYEVHHQRYSVYWRLRGDNETRPIGNVKTLPVTSGCFDSDWRFLRADARGAEAPGFDDSAWRLLDLPHDWSIEDLPPRDEASAPELPVVTGPWRFQKGDDAAWKASDFDDSQWQSVTLPNTWERHSNYRDNDVYGWYRRHIDIPAECQGKDFDLLLGCIDDVDETFLNGQRIGGTGSFPPDYRTAYDAQRRYRVPASLVRGDGSDVLAVRVFDSAGEGGIYRAGGKSMRVGPFDSGLSEGGASTGYFVGGTGWYRKHFTLPASDAGKHVTICFDGVYMNADVWLNGHHLGNHPYGYTSFVYDLTPYLQPTGQENVLAVRVRNTGRNSRWYSGSGIYRHVWLNVTDPVHIPVWGVYVTTPEVSKTNATVRVATTIDNDRGADVAVRLRTRLLSPDGEAIETKDSEVHIPAGQKQEFTQDLSVNDPMLWSLDTPALYRADIELIGDQKVLDRSETTFGIRTLRFTAEKGFELNGEPVLLKGGCMHHDNGPLGAAAIDRAEERRVQLMKAYGFNAIRTSHNPPSPAFLDACDRTGILVMDEAFDCWEEGKNPDDYGQYFKDWWQRDLASMILRDRNHPSIIMWSIGNEIPQRGDERGFVLAEQLRDEVRRLDPTRPVTEAVCSLWDGRPWSAVQKMFTFLDVAGYNYQWRQYVPDHEKSPERIIVGTESFPREAFENWQAVLDHPYVIGDFVWTSWDYLGETGIGNAVLDNEPSANLLPWFNAFCGDVDLCGFKKPQLYYRDVIWGNARINLAVHAPIPAGHRERVSGWGWPDERQSWTWPGCDGQPLDVTVYSSCPSVRLELDGEEIATQPVNDRMIVRFKVPYQPGELRAVGLAADGQPIAGAVLRTAGEPKAIHLTVDRSDIRADRNDLAYVTVEIVDEHGMVVPNAAIPVRFAVSGVGELAATGSGAPNDASSFQLPVRKTWRGRCLVILRPKGDAGTMTLKAEADGVEAATIVVTTR